MPFGDLLHAETQLRRRAMNSAQPPANFAPIVSDKLAAFAEEQGMSLLEAAALERHGMPII